MAARADGAFRKEKECPRRRRRRRARGRRERRAPRREATRVTGYPRRSSIPFFDRRRAANSLVVAEEEPEDGDGEEGVEDGDEDGEERDWTGDESEFENTFRYAPSIGSETLLVDETSQNPFSGNISLAGKDYVSHQSFREGLLHGLSKKIGQDGSAVEARYVNGLLHGEMNFYDSAGNLRSKIRYSEGRAQPLPREEQSAGE